MTQPAAPSRRGVYTATRLTKGTISPEELRALALNWRTHETAAAFAERVREEGVVSKQTAKRIEDLAVMFRVWFLTPDDQPARALRTLVAAGGDRAALDELAFLYKARAERVLYDFTVERFWPGALAGDLYLRTRDIIDFLDEAQAAGAAAQQWSTATMERLAQGMLRALADAGFVRVGARGVHEYLPYHVTDGTVAYLAYDLHFDGLSDAAVVEHPDWQLFGLSRDRVLDRLDGLGERGKLIVQRAGSVVRMTWLHPSREEVIHAYRR